MYNLNAFILEIEPVFYIHIESQVDYRYGPTGRRMNPSILPSPATTCRRWWYLVMYDDHLKAYDYRIKGETVTFLDTVDYCITLTIPTDTQL